MLAAVAAAATVAAGCNGIVRLGELDPPPGALVVVDVDVDGNHGVGDSALIEGLFTHSTFVASTEDQPLLDRTELPTDAERLEATYARHGYFDARVVDVRIEPRSEDSVEVVFVVEEGEPTVVATLGFEGLSEFELTGDHEAARRLRQVAGDLLSLAELEPGEVWTEARHQETETKIAAALQELGFAYATVRGRAFVDREARQTAVVFDIRHGPLVRIGSTEVQGNDKVSGERILARASVAPGTIATPDALEQVEERVFDLGNFFFVRSHLRDRRANQLRDRGSSPGDSGLASVAIGDRDDDASAQAEAEAAAGDESFSPAALSTSEPRDPRGLEGAPPPGRAAQQVDEAPRSHTVESYDLVAGPGEILEPLVVELQEQPFNELSGGIGGAIGANRSDVHLAFGYENLDFLGGLRKLDVELRPELVFLSDSFGGAEVMAPGGRAQLVFRQPAFLEEMLELRTTATYDLRVDYGYQLHHVAAQPRLSRKFLRFIELYAGYNIEYFQYFNVSERFDQPARELLGFAFRESYLISGLEQGLTLDLRDDVLDTRNGFYAATTVSEALTALGSDFEYYRVLGDLRGYLTFWAPLTLATRIKIGRVFTASPNQDVPLAARFRGGGPNDHRGFGYDRMGPSICLERGREVDRSLILDDGLECPGGVRDQVFVGGDLMIGASLETRWTLPWSLLDFPFGVVAFADLGEVFDTVGDFSSGELHVAVGPGLRWLTPVGPVRFDLGVLLTGPLAGSPELHFSIGQAF